MPGPDRAAAADLLVIGGGITGLAAALAAAAAGARVRVLDAGINAGSAANAGSLHVQLQSRFLRLFPAEAPNVEASLPLYRAAVAEWDRLAAAHGPFDLVRKGGLMLAEDADQLRFLEAKAKREAARGLDVEILERAALERLAPWLGRQIVGAELCRDEGKLNPLAANARLAAAAAARGVAVVRAHIVALEAGTRAVARGACGGRWEGAQALVAAAWGTGALLAPFGLALPIRAEPLQMTITEAAAVEIVHLVQHAERPITLKQFGTGQIVIGGGWPAEARGTLAPPRVLPASLVGNIALAARLVPGIAPLRAIRSWAGINTFIDGKTVLGRLPGAPAITVAVPGDAGYTLGPLVGRMAAEIALGLPTAEDPAPYAVSRFAARISA